MNEELKNTNETANDTPDNKEVDFETTENQAEKGDNADSGISEENKNAEEFMNDPEKDEKVKVIVEHHGRQKSFFERILSVFLVTAICAVCFLGGMLFERTNTNGVYVNKLSKIESLIDDNYYFKDNINHDKAFENAIDAYVMSLGDPFTYYLDEEYLEEFNESVLGGYVGIGVSVTTDSEGYVTITECFKGGSAQEGGVLAGYKIIAVDGESVVGEKLDDVVSKIKGEEGGKVTVTFLTTDDIKKEIELERKAVTINTVSSKIIEDDIGYVKISSFDLMTGKEFKEHLDEITKKDLKGLVIDLRNNSGGLLDSVVEVSDYVMPEGTIVTIKNRNAKDEIYKSDEKCVKLPIVCLVNGNTASAAELLAGGLKINNDSVLVGEKTFGKGVVGTQFYVDSKTAMVLTTGEYFLPDGTNIHKKGIEPDIVVDIDENSVNLYLLKEEDDTQLKKAIEEIKAK